MRFRHLDGARALHLGQECGAATRAGRLAAVRAATLLWILHGVRAVVYLAVAGGIRESACSRTARTSWLAEC